jgi:hydrogenase nickel incorporation protein HypA/HybF
LVIEEVPVVAYCPGCLVRRTLASIQYFACPECEKPVSEILEGRELQVVALEIRE